MAHFGGDLGEMVGPRNAPNNIESLGCTENMKKVAVEENESCGKITIVRANAP